MDEAKNAMGDAAEKMEEGAKDLAEDVEDGAKKLADDAKDATASLKESLSEGFATASEKAKTALADVEGGSEMLAKVKELFAGASSAIKNATDEESAEAAKAKLAELEEDAEGLKEKAATMPAEAKTALANLIASGKEHLQTLMEKINENPTVSESIKPKIESLLAKLSEIVEKPTEN